MQALQIKLARLKNVPEEIKKNGKYCSWKLEPRKDKPKPAKVPYNPKTGQRANVADPSTFCSFDEALAHLTPEFNGIGILIDGSISALDLDNCLNEQGHLTPMADDIVRTMNCYTEVSPSGRGIRILFTVAPGYDFKKNKYYINNQKIGVEAYIADATPKYVTLTGNTNTPGVGLEERSAELNQVLEKYMLRNKDADPADVATANPAAQPPGRQPQLTADPNLIVQRIQSSRSGQLFQKLFDGDMSDYGNDHSKADLAFCNFVAAFTKDPLVIDTIVRRSKLMRPKWDSPRGNTTYGRMTIDNAIRTAIQYERTRAVAAQPPVLVGDQPISASELMKLNLPELVFLVEGMLAQGTVAILAGSPKGGKSWLALELGLAIAGNTKFLGCDTEQGGVLYLALEDSPRRIQNRLRKVLQGGPAPDNMYLMNTAPPLLGGLLEQLDKILEAHSDIKVVIIDTLQMVRMADSAGVFSYTNDYRDLGLFKKYSETRRIAMVLIHHVRKSKDDANPFNDIAGTNGVLGAVDAAYILDRKRGETEATLHITGRDIPETSLAIDLDKDTMRWESLGDAEALRQEREKQAFLSEPLVQTVFELVKESPANTWSGQASELVAAGTARGRDLGTPQNVGYQLRNYANDFSVYLGIKYDAADVNGNAGKRHKFELLEHEDAAENESAAGNVIAHPTVG